MGLDIRLPIGLMFCLLGPILLWSGLAEGAPLSTRTGAAMLAFGAVMLALGVRGQRNYSMSVGSLSSPPSSSSSSKEMT